MYKQVLVLVLGLVLLSSPVFASSHKSMDIVDTAVKAGTFTTLVAAVKAAALVEPLKGPGPYTVFAPSDEAFAKLPAGTVENLLKPENRIKLQNLVKNHIVAGKVTGEDLTKLYTVKTLIGQPLTVKSRYGKTDVGEARVTKADIKTSNGVIHVIDKVLVPKF